MNALLDAAVIAGREAIKLALVWHVCRAFFSAYKRPGLMRSFHSGLGAAFMLVGLSLFLPHGMAMREFAARLSGYTFFLFFMAALAFIWGGLRTAPGGNATERLSVSAGAVIFFAPDLAGATMYLREAAVISASPVRLSMVAAGAFVIGLGVFLRQRPLGTVGSYLARYMGPAELCIFLVIVKLMAGGLGWGWGGSGEISLVSNVQQGLVKFVHDALHQGMLFVMVPDHPLLVTTTWKFIGLLFSEGFTGFLALVILASPVAVHAYVSLTAEIVPPADMASGAERRIYRARCRAFLRRRSIMAVAFVALVFVSWYAHRGGGSGVSLVMPEPRPMVSSIIDKVSVVNIPLKGPGEDLMDGALHKFSVTLADGKVVRFLIVRKPGGQLAVALDACEICPPPEGYGMSVDHLVCVYCMTPVPVETVGKPGGCNPIALRAEITDDAVLVRMDEIAAKWRYVISDKDRAGLSESESKSSGEAIR